MFAIISLIFLLDLKLPFLSDDACYHIGNHKFPKKDNYAPNWPHGYEIDKKDSDYVPSKEYVPESLTLGSPMKDKSQVGESSKSSKHKNIKEKKKRGPNSSHSVIEDKRMSS